MKGETGRGGEVKWSSVTIKYSQVFPPFRVPSFLIGRPVHWVSAHVEIHCLYICVCVFADVYVFTDARVLCAFRHASLAPCTSVCV